MDDRKIRELIRPFDPLGADAEERYDTVVRRVNRSRALKARLRREYERLETQFVEGDLIAQSGARRGQPLTASGRRRRLSRLVEVGSELNRLAEEERFALSALDRMNAELDRWARETYGQSEHP